ncbi:MAG: tetratricopeptide repeat protein, partial [Chloroflexota bacterium]|nr:tetratricopeptide repeat protein [Chloroflexota bacterium]
QFAACRRAIESAERAGRPDLARHAMPPMMMAAYLGSMPLEEVAEMATQMITGGNGRVEMEGAAVWLGLAQVLSGSTEEGLANIERGFAEIRDLGLVIAVAGSTALEADAYTAMGDLASAAGRLRAGAATLRDAGELGILSFVAGYLSVVLAEMGELNEAEEAAAESRTTATADDIASQLAWRAGLAVVRARQGAHTEAEPLAREAVELAGRTDSPAFQAMTSSALAVVLAAEGRVDEARAAQLEAIQLNERKGNLAMASRLRREGAVDTAQPSWA